MHHNCYHSPSKHFIHFCFSISPTQELSMKTMMKVVSQMPWCLSHCINHPVLKGLLRNLLTCLLYHRAGTIVTIPIPLTRFQQSALEVHLSSFHSLLCPFFGCQPIVQMSCTSLPIEMHTYQLPLNLNVREEILVTWINSETMKQTLGYSPALWDYMLWKTTDNYNVRYVTSLPCSIAI